MIDLGPVDLRETSVTERADFRVCRRRWFLNTVKRLVPSGGVPHFWFGNLMHYALEHYYLGQKDGDADPEQYAREAFDLYVRDSLADISLELGFLWDSAADEYNDMVGMGRGMLEGYFLMERETGGIGKVIEVERRYKVPIRSLNGRALPRSPLLTGRFDLLVERDNGDIWVVDHKTAASRHNSAHLDLDDQLTGYAYVYWRATGKIPRGQVYNVLLKKVPGPPKRLKDAKDGTPVLSRDKAQATTYSYYRAELRKLGLPLRDYADILDFLKDRGWQDYFIQEGVFRNARQLAVFEQNLFYEWMDMRDVARHPDKAYPAPSAISCPGCPVKLICATMQDAGDVDAIIEGNFTVAEERR